MKRTILMLSITALAAIGMESCQKEQVEKAAITQTVNVQLKVNTDYTFTLPKNLRDDPYEITTAASHAKISSLGKDADGNRIYSYTPALGYVGTDQVVLSNDQERYEHHDKGHKPPMGPPPSGGCNGNPPPQCNGGEEDHYIVTINFVIDKDQTVNSN